MKHIFVIFIHICAFLLVTLYGLSFLSEVHWVFEFLRSLLLAYIFASIVVIFIYVGLGRYKFALGITGLFLCLLFEIHSPPPRASTDSNASTITIAQFNKHGRNRDLTATIEWLSSAPAAIIVVQEVLRSDVNTLRDVKVLKELYPHRFPETRLDGLDIYTLSRFPLNGEIIELQTPAGPRKAIRMKISLPNSLPDLSLYSIHTARPAPTAQRDIRNAQLTGLADIIASDPSAYIALAGDLNIAPWVPEFKNMLERAKLHYAANGLFTHATWPSYSRFPFLQIPIDHILANENLVLIENTSGPMLGSDHRPYISKLIFIAENRNE